ncbi:glycoside hydrolase family 97 C-terminal domain-containing protein [Fibrella aestuarina]|uniref:glycoside hydrolase family 97 C-terminal domain-containing protein n=1 Tax=Fibrella aestuarina TaxID=651143 RepID=UPI000A05D610|nr:glycoside hydrolase family 97 C-terminal domain-containing protein [Fibrella aestuarina]
MSDENSHELPLFLDFLDPNHTYKAILYRDADNADWATNPAAYVVEKKTVTAQTNLTLRLAKGGGCAIQLVRR